ncbi:hypothetical protein [Tepidibacter aestuarii]|uniref:hypothetical protein n=1 Tax=Tepidibacter aestuarii TaxID=2925782 RepID=UPI0020C1644E|nr:hypothetical protein [Tepidibacter aestuarii]CAH2213224.1 protein of unknown function [Tepidibacter aestuarii]
MDQLRNGWYPADPITVIENEFVVAVNKLVEKGVINSPNYWLNNKIYKVEYVRELIKNSAKKLK